MNGRGKSDTKLYLASNRRPAGDFCSAGDFCALITCVRLGLSSPGLPCLFICFSPDLLKNKMVPLDVLLSNFLAPVIDTLRFYILGVAIAHP